MKEIQQILTFYDQHREDNSPMVLATVVHIEDSSYRREGARMLIRENGEWIGGISGGCLEGDALKQAKQVLITGKPRVVTYDTRDDDPYQIGAGLGCEGRIDVFLERVVNGHPSIEVLRDSIRRRDDHIIYKVYGSDRQAEPLLGYAGFHLPENVPISGKDLRAAVDEVLDKRTSDSIRLSMDDHTWSVLLEYRMPPIRLVLAGDNYDIYPVLEYAETLGWEVILIGKARKLRNDSVKNLGQIFSPKRLADLPGADPFTAVVAMSHDYDIDSKVLNHYVEQSVGFLGVLGPRKRFEKIREALELTDTQAGDIYNPLGLDIGAISPEEIGLAITSEIVKSFRGGDGVSLSKKSGFIHGRN